ncbi:TIR domain-containing protein [Variovorax sp. LT1R16]|uniref:TIR domain-containing protein n=1 Tax=Variovorax sp. LT1R16 TaxID=3443728 RepID=UPI003F481595
MAIKIDALRSAATRQATVVTRSLNEARTLGVKTAFLCHSHHDANLAKGLVQLLSDAGWRVYIDWQDAEMPDTPSRETAQRIKQKIVDLEYFLFLATPKSARPHLDCPDRRRCTDARQRISAVVSPRRSV